MEVTTVIPQIVGAPRSLGAQGGSQEASSWLHCRRRQEETRHAEERPAESSEAFEFTFDEGGSIPEALTAAEMRWALILVLFSSLDLLVSGVLAGFAFRYAYRDNGTSLYCIGIQSISHFGSSLVLVLRFMPEMLPAREDDGAVSDGCLLRERRRSDLVREQACAIFMGLAMMISCVGLLYKAIQKFKLWDVWSSDHSLEDNSVAFVTDMMAWWGFGIFSVQALARWLLVQRLRCSLVRHSLAVSIVNLLFFLVLGFAASYEREWSWKAEPIAAVVLVLVMMVESIRMVIINMGDVDLRLRVNPRV